MDLVEQFIHAPLLGLACLLFALQAALGTALQPALPDSLPAPPLGMLSFQARVTLRKIVAEQRLLPTRFQNDPLLPACRPDEPRQVEGDELVLDDGVNAGHQSSNEAGIN